LRAASVATPTSLSSIFSPKVLDGDRFRDDPERTGALGGGFSFHPGVETFVEVLEDEESVSVEINDEPASFPPSEEAVKTVRELTGLTGGVRIRHKIHVPIATGFGTSAAAALGVILCLSYLTGNPLTLREALRITHRVELKCRTGLNSEAGFGKTGLVLVLREGGPDNSVTDVIPLPAGCKIVSVVAGQIKTPDTVASPETLKQLERLGDRYMERIVSKPTPENFLAQARRFAVDSGLATPEVLEIFTYMEKLPTVGYAQNMVGKAVHAVIHPEDVETVVNELKQRFPGYGLYVGEPGSTITISIKT
jgi:pantoate kinase